MRIAFNSALLVALPFLVSFCLCSTSEVVDLTKETPESFADALRKVGPCLVEFFAPWCGHCKRLAPEYDKASLILKKNEPPVTLVKVDCTSEDGGKELCNKFGVSGFPTLKIFRDGEVSQDYQGPRDADGIVRYMQSQVGDASKQLLAFSELNDLLKKAADVVVVGIFDTESDALAKKFLKTADKLRDTVKFAHVLTESATGAVGDVDALKDLSVSAPAVVLVRSASLKSKFEPSSVVYDTSIDRIEDFITANYHGLVGHRTQNNMQDFKTPNVICYYDVDYVKNAKGTNYWRNRILKVAEQNKGSELTFAISNAQQFAGELEEYGLEASRDNKPVVAARDIRGHKYVMSEEFSVDTLAKFVKDLLDEKLTAYIKSEEIPADNSGPVKVAVGKNFDELVINSEKDTLIEFYAPWCGHCKKLAPVWEELGEALKDEPNVQIVKMDATGNDVVAPFVVHGFPTIYFYPADTKEAKKYEGGRDKEDFIKYIAKHASKELKTYARDGKKKKVQEEL